MLSWSNIAWNCTFDHMLGPQTSPTMTTVVYVTKAPFRNAQLDVAQNSLDSTMNTLDPPAMATDSIGDEISDSLKVVGDAAAGGTRDGEL
jgi:hypothetical protein